MAGNGNRGPNDFRGRNGRRRREPPLIDASATEVPLDADAPEEEPALSETPRPGEEPVSDPVLFGGARRAPEAASAGIPAEASPVAGPGEPAVVPSALDGEPAPGEPAPVAASAPEAGAEPAAAPSDVPAAETSAAPEAAPSEAPAVEEPAGRADPVPPPEDAFVPPPPAEPARPAAAAEPASSMPAAVPAARSGGGAAWLLGVSNLVLLGALAWVLYTGPQRDGLADLRRQVAGLEARPDASKVSGDVAALDKRLGAADADRQTLSKSVAGLTARLDAVAQQAQSAKADAGAAQSDANRPAPTGAAAAATVGALAALAARIDGVDKSVSALSADQGRTAKAVADLPKPVPPDFGPVNARVAGLDARVAGLDARVAGLDTQLSGRLAALDGKVNGTDARLNGFDAKVNAVDAKVNGSDARLNGVDARANALEAKLNDEAAGLARLRSAVADLPKVDLGPLQAATAGLDKRVAAMEAQLSAPKDGARVTTARAVGSADLSRAAPLALVGQAVQRAIADGRPYAADLDTLKALGAEPAAVAQLQPFAAGGAPTAAALKARWDAVRGDVLAAVQPAATGSAFDRFADSARALVQVRNVGAVPGDDPAALVTQVDAALAGGDVAGALAAWNRLPQAGRDRSKDWAAAARARVDAAGAAQALVGRAIATLGRTDG